MNPAPSGPYEGISVRVLRHSCTGLIAHCPSCQGRKPLAQVDLDESAIEKTTKPTAVLGNSEDHSSDRSPRQLKPFI